MHILVAEKSSFSSKGIEAFSELGSLDAADLSQEQLEKRIVVYDILLVRLGLLVNRSVIRAGNKLKIIGTPTTGLDHIDQEAASQRNIVVLSLKGEREFLEQVFATAEHTFALLLSLVRKIPAAFDAVKRYEWRRDYYRGNELNGKTLGIVGYGRLGTMVANYALVFGMQVLVYDPYVVSLGQGIQRCASLEELLTNSDIVSLHAPLNAETAGMISTAQFQQMRPGTILINTARGALIDEVALLRALESGQLGGAALDVLHNEHQLSPDSSNPLIEYSRTHSNLILTPHIGGATQESVEKADLFLARKIRQHLAESGLEHTSQSS